MRLNGHIKEIDKFKPLDREMCLYSSISLSNVFIRNAEQCKKIGITVKDQIKEIYNIYGMKISVEVFSMLKNGRRYKCGLLLLMTIKHYWKMKGFDFKIEL